MREVTLKQEIPQKWLQLFPKPERDALKAEWDFLLSVVNKNKSAIHLDFATGTGRFLREIATKTKGEMVALDFGCGTCRELQYFLKKIRKYSRVSIVCADARKMPFKTGAFDSATSWHGLDEPKMEKTIEEAERVLKKDGWLGISGLHYREGSKSFLRAQKHGINLITQQTIVRTLEVAGFREIEHETLYEGHWNEKEAYLPVFEDWYLVYAAKGRK